MLMPSEINKGYSTNCPDQESSLVSPKKVIENLNADVLMQSPKLIKPLDNFCSIVSNHQDLAN